MIASPFLYLLTEYRRYWYYCVAAPLGSFVCGSVCTPSSVQSMLTSDTISRCYTIEAMYDALAALDVDDLCSPTSLREPLRLYAVRAHSLPRRVVLKTPNCEAEAKGKGVRGRSPDMSSDELTSEDESTPKSLHLW